MDATPNRRFVQLRLPADDHEATFTLRESGGEAPPTRDNHEILRNMAVAEPSRAQAVEAKLSALIGREAELFSWLESDPGRTELFLKNPIAALSAAFPDLGADYFHEFTGKT